MRACEDSAAAAARIDSAPNCRILSRAKRPTTAPAAPRASFLIPPRARSTRPMCFSPSSPTRLKRLARLENCASVAFPSFCRRSIPASSPWLNFCPACRPMSANRRSSISPRARSTLARAMVELYSCWRLRESTRAAFLPPAAISRSNASDAPSPACARVSLTSSRRRFAEPRSRPSDR